ncbi:MAG: ACP S-malonyltransferase [Phycisphaerae bacterium]
MSSAFLFPGQGSQYVGMGQDLLQDFPIAGKIFDQADHILGFKISELCFAGPQEKLNATDIQQPAVFVMSVAALEAMRTSEKFKDVQPAFAAGLSLGEYTAYYAAGSLNFESAVKLVAARSRFMQEAARAVDGTMVAVVGLDDEKVIEICNEARENEILVPANFNCPGQVVVSGHRGACVRAAQLAEKAGAMKAIVLDVAGAFHSPLMQPAADKLKTVLEQTEFHPPKIPVISNVDCEFHTDLADIRQTLYRQVTASTYWGKSMEKLLSLGVDQFFEIGPKRTLTGFLKRIDRKAKAVNISGVADLR